MYFDNGLFVLFFCVFAPFFVCYPVFYDVNIVITMNIINI